MCLRGIYWARQFMCTHAIYYELGGLAPTHEVYSELGSSACTHEIYSELGSSACTHKVAWCVLIRYTLGQAVCAYSQDLL